jgi:hypothetical protein
MLARALLLIAKVDGKAPCQYVGEGVLDDDEVGGETPYQ